MLAARLHEYGDPAGLVVEEVAEPLLAEDHLLVRVAAASINPVDWKIVDGILRERIPLELPLVPGGDVSGIVERVGGAVTGFAVGDAVHAMTGTIAGYAHGGFAQQAAIRASSAARKPRTLDHAGAAAASLAALTAWQALHDRGEIQPGERVLIHAAAGGVGGFAVQFAREAGAYVIGTASASNLDYVRQLGAMEAIDYAAGPFEDQLRDVDLVIDLIGGDVQLRSFKSLRRGGRLVNAWGALAVEAAETAGVRAIKVAVAPNGADLRRIGALIDAGRVRVDVAHRLPLGAVHQALALSRLGHGRGKIALEIE